MSSETAEPAGGADVRRLHPSTLLFSLLGQIKRFVLPLVVVLFLAPKDSWELWLGLFVIPAMVFETYRYLTFRYRFETDELVVTRGVLFKSERHVPFARIQNVDSRQSFLQRLFGVAEARVETASGAEAEAELKVVSLDMLEEVRARVFGGAAGVARGLAGDAEPPPGAAPAAGRTLFEVPLGDLTLLGLDPGRGLALVAVALGAAWEFDVFERVGFDELLKSSWRQVHAGGAAVWILLLALAALVLVLALSLLSTYVRLYGFRLERSEQGFRVHCGLWTHVATTVRRRRIQLLSIAEPPLLRWLGRASVKVETAGAKQEGDEAAATRQWFLPVVRRSQLPELLREIDPRLDLAAVRWESLAPKALRRMRKLAILLSLAATLVALGIARPWGALVLPVLLPFGLWLAQREAAYAAWSRTDWGVLYRSGALYRKVGVVFFDRIQVVSLAESPFDRRYRMASVHVDTAGAGKVGHKVHIPYLDREVARALREELVSRAERSPLLVG